MSGINQDQDGITVSGETVREAKSRGGKQQMSRGVHRQVHGSAKTPLGSTWLQVRRDWESGAFSQRALADAHSIPIATLRSRMAASANAGDPWGSRPIADLVSKALPGLMDATTPGVDPSAGTIESIIAQTEGRPVDPDAVANERAGGVAQRKAIILRGHRSMADRYQKLVNRTMDLLEEYVGGSMPFAFVRSKDAQGNPIVVPFHLLSKQHGFMDGVERAGSIMERTIKLQRMAHGLDGVDGDGNQIKPGSGGVNPYAGLSDDELKVKVLQLASSLTLPSRVTPVPSGLDPAGA